MLQLRDPALDDDALLAVAARWRAACDRHGALLWVNDRPDLALAAERRRRARGPGRRRRGRRARAGGRRPADRPVHPLARAARGGHRRRRRPAQRRPGVGDADQARAAPPPGLEYVRHAAERRPPVPWFAIGGIDRGNAREVAEAGAERIVVVRAVRDAADPGAAAAELRAAVREERRWRSAVAARSARSASARAPRAPARGRAETASAPRAAPTSWRAATPADERATRRRAPR